jgi:predicted transcriptional regulator
MEAGYTVLPSVFLERQQALGLDAVDINIILHLARHWWYSENLPYPSKNTIAECMGIDASTVRRRVKALESAGLIQRKPRYHQKGGQLSNHYDFEGLIKEATPYARELIQEREDRRNEAVARRRRKRPVLRVISDDTRKN